MIQTGDQVQTKDFKMKIKSKEEARQITDISIFPYIGLLD
jgi:hypothetical protein